MSEPAIDSGPDLNHGPGQSGFGPSGDGYLRESATVADISGYDDYRAYMRDRFAELQAREPAFSQRGLARKAGFANPGFFNEVIKGRRRLSPGAAAKISIGLGLSSWETEYFSSLVKYTETRDPIVKLCAGRRMMALKNRRLYHALSAMQSPTEVLREIMRELEGDWVLQAAGLDLDLAIQEGRPIVLDPMNESTLRGILEKLVCMRIRADSGPDPQVVHLSLRMAPRMPGRLS